MRIKKKHIVNLFFLLVSVITIGFIAQYYYTYLGTAHAQETTNVEVVLPENHPAISINSDLKFPAEESNCLACHQGIEPTRPLDTEMMKQILAKGAALGDPNGCVICHGGTASELLDEDRAHSGVPKGSLLAAFTPVPGALQVNENTCGQCHQDHTYNAHRSLMNSDAGKMKTITWSFGIGTENNDHIYANHDIDDPDGSTPRFGTDRYKAYMKEMAEAFPGQYPRELKQIPEVDMSKLQEMPEQAAFTYLRNCNACHLSNKGMQDRGHYRGMGCAACHSVYSNEGYYEGGDPSIDKENAGHLLVHAMQGTRKSAYTLNNMDLSGVQVSTCAACHSAGRRIGHAYQGLMAMGSSHNRGPFDENGLPQQTNSGYVFKYIQSDAHHQLEKDGKMVTGLLCQDCHTTTSMHGNGNIGSTTLATVEVECADCHGTPDSYPWELPLGYGDEFGKDLSNAPARGVANEPMKVTQEFGITYPKQDGYLLSARGNPFGNVVRKGNTVIVHSDGGYDWEAPTLKGLKESGQWNDKKKAVTAMINVPQHMDKMECYACHSTWVPQYYGYKYVIDYSKESIDWLDSPEKFGADGTTADYHSNFVMQPGAPTYGDYSHTRWESPPLGINGEGRVTPLVGVIQTVSTVIDEDGETITWNKAYKTEEGHNAMELAPVNPHTTSLQARDCADCHGSNVAMGYGIDGGKYDANPAIQRFADIVDVNGENVSVFTQVQINAIKDLHNDFMQAINEDGMQVQTVDSHWPDSSPLTSEQLDVMARSGTCTACHQDLPNLLPARFVLQKIAKVANLSFKDEQAHSSLLRENNIMISWIKALGIIALILLIPIAIFAYRKRETIKEAYKRMKG